MRDPDPFDEDEPPKRSEWETYRAIARRMIPTVRATWEQRRAELGHDQEERR